MNKKISIINKINNINILQNKTKLKQSEAKKDIIDINLANQKNDNQTINSTKFTIINNLGILDHSKNLLFVKLKNKEDNFMVANEIIFSLYCKDLKNKTQINNIKYPLLKILKIIKIIQLII